MNFGYTVGLQLRKHPESGCSMDTFMVNESLTNSQAYN